VLPLGYYIERIREEKRAKRKRREERREKRKEKEEEIKDDLCFVKIAFLAPLQNSSNLGAVLEGTDSAGLRKVSKYYVTHIAFKDNKSFKKIHN
jgi:hypothetical protein